MTDVRLVTWPDEARDGTRLVEEGVAVLYLVNPEDDAPTVSSCLEDWIRLPGDERDLLARVAALRFRASTHHGPPRLDSSGRLHYDGQVTALPTEQIGPARLLVERYGELVHDSELHQFQTDLPRTAGQPQPNGASSPRPLRATMTELRRTTRDLGLTLRRVPRRGYILERR